MTAKSVAAWLLSLIVSWFGTPANDLAFRPVLGSTVEKSFETEWNIEIDPLQIWVMSFNAMGYLPDDFKLEATLSEKVCVADTYLLAHRGFPWP